MRPRVTVFAVLSTLALLACGGDDEDGSGRNVEVERASGVVVEATEYAFDPASVTVEGAGSLRIRLDNRGSLAHNLRLLRDGRDVGGTSSFAGGRSHSATVRLEPGDYSMVCTVGDHDELGMNGTLRVR